MSLINILEIQNKKSPLDYMVSSTCLDMSHFLVLRFDHSLASLLL